MKTDFWFALHTIDPKKTLDSLLKHCKNCKHFSITTDGYKEFYECSLLEDKRIQELEEEDEEYIPDGTEGLLAVAHYDVNGNLTDVEIMDSYPESCPKNKGKEAEND